MRQPTKTESDYYHRHLVGRSARYKSVAFHLPTERKTLKTAKAIKSYLESFCNKRSAHVVNLVGGGTRVVEARWHG